MCVKGKVCNFAVYYMHPFSMLQLAFNCTHIYSHTLLFIIYISFKDSYNADMIQEDSNQLMGIIPISLSVLLESQAVPLHVKEAIDHMTAISVCLTKNNGHH